MAGDMVNHPKHYIRGKFEHIDIVENWELGYHVGNATKYMMRAGHKLDVLEDLQKARWYLSRAIEKPWCSVVIYDEQSCTSIPFRYSAAEVALDWFELGSSLYDAMIVIGKAVRAYSSADAVACLLQARAYLDIEIIKLQKAAT